MSQYCGPQDSGPVLDAAEHWRRQALQSDGSVFSNTPLWTQEHIESLVTYFVDNLDLGEGNFLEKLERQLESAEPETKQLAAEMMWVILLCPSNTHAPKKREQIEKIWNCSGMRLSLDSQWLSDAVLGGIGSAGTAYNTNRWRELVFMIRFGQAWKALPAGDRQRLLSDGWAFAEWLSDIPEADTRQIRHMLLFLLFPDDFERIFGGTDRRSIVAAFTQKPNSEVQKYDPIRDRSRTAPHSPRGRKGISGPTARFLPRSIEKRVGGHGPSRNRRDHSRACLGCDQGDRG